MMGELAEKVIFLTGGAQGIGRACAIAYARAGGSVVIADINLDLAKATLERDLQGNGLAIQCDVASSESVRAAIEQTLAHYGKIDAIHNNAAISRPSAPLHETSEEQWDALMATNLKSVYYTTFYGIDALKASRGCILNTASMVGVLGQERHAAYVATKGAMIALTKAMALDYASYGIRVNAICPAAVWTPLLHEWVQDQPDPAAARQFLDGIHVLGYCPDGDVVADAAVFLLSERARFITGVALPVSGGAELGYRRIAAG
ncbi:SDR family NAD(P)-dependent oxidoreductase [Roseiflexus castenholzii]|uniref:Short-chain dehydrogenase/reductase SDR n=1 Tax=Roseiflexus castenholzii (strain DSM 13941 / HLO8) TaxID=383372 RepID=A7NL33_ROSCS|nr:SDR family oxidoreductase [Roseiflexus castenholzii]ABU58203.1 short-chain dehydrogenase/reductase SDR [Roseiflexus castenholzii DSM 13941]